MVTKTNTEMETIVTLTSFGKRIRTTMPQSVESINKQIGFKPELIVLYVTRDDYESAKSVSKQFDNLDVRTVPEDIRCYKKYTALTEREFDDKFVWVIDDDLYYSDYDYESFVKTYDKHNGKPMVYGFNFWEVKSFDEYFYRNQIKKNGIVKGNYVIGCNKIFPPNVARLEPNFLNAAFRISPTCDDTYLSPYLISSNISVCKIKLPDDKFENYKQLEIPSNTIKLINVNRYLWKSNLKRNFDHFGLYRP